MQRTVRERTVLRSSLGDTQLTMKVRFWELLVLFV